MPLERCSCGFEIPEGAQFCPGCARPLTEEALEQERKLHALHQPPPVEEEPLPEEMAPPPIGFSNPLVVRSCYWSAVGASLLSSLPILSLLCFVWYPGAGFLATASYRKRVGFDPTPREGAKLGWITGVITFALSLILWVAGVTLSGGLAAQFASMQQSLEEAGQAEVAEQMAPLLESPAALAVMMAFGLVFLFAFTVTLTSLGGALGAKVLEKE